MKSPLQQMLNASVVERAQSCSVRVDTLLHTAFSSDRRLCEALVPQNIECVEIDDNSFSWALKRASALLEKDITVAQGTVSRLLFTPGKQMRHDMRVAFGWIARTAMGTAFADRAADGTAPTIEIARDVVLTRLKHAFSLLSGASSTQAGPHTSPSHAPSVEAAVDRVLCAAEAHGVPVVAPPQAYIPAADGTSEESRHGPDFSQRSTLFDDVQGACASEEPSSSHSTATATSTEHTTQVHEGTESTSATHLVGNEDGAANSQTLTGRAQSLPKESPSISARQLYAPTTFVEQHVPAAIAMLTCAHLWCTAGKQPAASAASSAAGSSHGLRITPGCAVRTVMSCLLELLETSGIRITLRHDSPASSTSAAGTDGCTATLNVDVSARAMRRHALRRDLLQSPAALGASVHGNHPPHGSSSSETDSLQRKILRVRAITTHLTAILECIRLCLRGFWPSPASEPPLAGSTDSSDTKQAGQGSGATTTAAWKGVNISAALMQVLVDLVQEAASLLVPGTETSLLAEHGFVSTGDILESQDPKGLRLSPSALWMRTTLARHFGYDLPALVVALHEVEGDSTVWLPVREKHGRVLWREHTGSLPLSASSASSAGSSSAHGRAAAPVAKLVLPQSDAGTTDDASSSDDDVLRRVTLKLDRQSMHRQAVQSAMNRVSASKTTTSGTTHSRKRPAPLDIIPKGMDRLEWAETKRRRIAVQEATNTGATGAGAGQPPESLESSSERAGRPQRVEVGAYDDVSSQGHAFALSHGAVPTEPAASSAARFPVGTRQPSASIGAPALKAGAAVADGPSRASLAPASIGSAASVSRGGGLPHAFAQTDMCDRHGKKALDDVIKAERNRRLADVSNMSNMAGEIVMKKGSSSASLPGTSMAPPGRGAPTCFAAPLSGHAVRPTGPPAYLTASVAPRVVPGNR